MWSNKEQIIERLRVSRQEGRGFREAIKSIEKKFGALNFDLRQLQDEWNDADSIRQEAYEALKALKKQEHERVRKSHSFTLAD